MEPFNFERTELKLKLCLTNQSEQKSFIFQRNDCASTLWFVTKNVNFLTWAQIGSSSGSRWKNERTTKLTASDDSSVSSIISLCRWKKQTTLGLYHGTADKTHSSLRSKKIPKNFQKEEITNRGARELFHNFLQHVCWTCFFAWWQRETKLTQHVVFFVQNFEATVRGNPWWIQDFVREGTPLDSLQFHISVFGLRIWSEETDIPCEEAIVKSTTRKDKCLGPARQQKGSRQPWSHPPEFAFSNKTRSNPNQIMSFSSFSFWTTSLRRSPSNHSRVDIFPFLFEEFSLTPTQSELDDEDEDEKQLQLHGGWVIVCLPCRTEYLP